MSKLPTQADIDKALVKIAQYYIHFPQYMISADMIAIVRSDDGSLEIQCRGAHHVANAYDLGRYLGAGLWITYGYLALKTGSFVRFSPIPFSIVTGEN